MYKSGLMELEAVVAIARLGSFRAAAVDLDVSPTATSVLPLPVSRTALAFASSTARPVTSPLTTAAGREYRRRKLVTGALSDIRNAAQAVADLAASRQSCFTFSCSVAEDTSC